MSEAPNDQKVRDFKARWSVPPLRDLRGDILTFVRSSPRKLSEVLSNAGLSVDPLIDLRGFDFSGLELTDRDGALSYANLDFAVFDGCQLEHVVMQNSSIRNASFRKATLREVSFFVSDLRQSVFAEAKMANCFCMHGNFSGADFSGSTLDQVAFSDANLLGAVFANSKVSKLDLDGCRIDREVLEQLSLEMGIDPNNFSAQGK